MNSAELKRAKKVVRARVRAVRDAIASERRDALGQSVAERFLELPEVGAARTVMAFWSFGSEVPTAELIERLHASGVTVGLPRVVEGELEPRTYVPGDPVRFAPFGAGEPTGGRVLRPDEIDIVITPGIAFDRRGKRIGYGGGFYDRFLPRAQRALRTGICFGVQLIDEDLPAGSSDPSVDVIVTESETLRIPRGST